MVLEKTPVRARSGNVYTTLNKSYHSLPPSSCTKHRAERTSAKKTRVPQDVCTGVPAILVHAGVHVGLLSTKIPNGFFVVIHGVLQSHCVGSLRWLWNEWIWNHLEPLKVLQNHWFFSVGSWKKTFGNGSIWNLLGFLLCVKSKNKKNYYLEPFFAINCDTQRTLL
jgi:hypothetical protein